MNIPKIKFENGNKMPILGFGTYTLQPEYLYGAIRTALNAGYRMLDTAKWYNNEPIVGKAIIDSNIPREELFITSKQESKGYDETIRGVLETLNRFHTNYLDLVLIHWPTTKENNEGTYKALEDLYDKGIIKSIGISNYHEELCEDLLRSCRIKPQINQIETNIYFQEDKMHKYLKEKNIVHEGWSPFAEGYSDMLVNPVIKEIADKYHKSNAQILLRYMIEQDIIVIPRSLRKEHIEENINIFDFELKEEDKAKLKSLDKKKQYSGWPQNMKVETYY